MTAAIFRRDRLRTLVVATALGLAVLPQKTWALASNNIPLDSPVYSYLEKLASFGLITSDIKGIRPLSKAEAARLCIEAEKTLAEAKEGAKPFNDKGYVITTRNYPPVPYEPAGGALADEMLRELRHLLEREIALRDKPDGAPLFDARPVSELRLRYFYLDGVPRNYDRLVHDPGGDGVFGIGSGLRPDNPPGFAVHQRGTEGTPLMENNEGVRYRKGSNADVRFAGELFGGRYFSALVEPMFLYSERGGLTQGRLNKGYAKIGGEGLELEVGRDENWLGLGDRGNVTLTNNAQNFDFVKISSPEPIQLKYVGAIKYTFMLSRVDETIVDGLKRQPFFYAAKLSIKPTDVVEVGLNLGRLQGGPGVPNTFASTLKGLVGGTSNDNSKANAGLELRLRLPFLRNTEIYGEFSGTDAALFWPICESYVGGVFIPRLTADGSNDLRFEYFLGNRIAYAGGTFPAGYNYNGMPIGHSQGGATQDFFLRYRHWFSARHNAGLEYIHTDRGKTGRVPGQSVEEKNGGRVFWNYPLYGRFDAGLMYGWERVHNPDLAAGPNRTNQVVKVDLTFRY